MVTTTKRTPAQAHALDILCEEGGEATLDVLTTEGGIRTTTINALARQGIVTLDGPWVEYQGEPGAPSTRWPAAAGGGAAPAGRVAPAAPRAKPATGGTTTSRPAPGRPVAWGGPHTPGRHR